MAYVSRVGQEKHVHQLQNCINIWLHMMSSNGNIFRVTGPLCGEFTSHRWIHLTKASDAELWCFLWSAPWINELVNNREVGDLRRHRAHYDVVATILSLSVWNMRYIFPTYSVNIISADALAPCGRSLLTVDKHDLEYIWINHKQLRIFQNIFLMLFTINIKFLHEFSPLQWRFCQVWGYWWPGAFAPGHQ